MHTDVLDQLADAVLAAERPGEIADHLIGHFVDQARRSGASWTDIGTEHPLLALLELEAGSAIPGPLHRCGVDKDRVEADLIDALESLTSGKDGDGSGPANPSPSP